MAKTSCSRKLLMATNTLATVIGLGGLVVCILALTTELLPSFRFLPQPVSFGVISISGFILIVSLLGILGLLIRSKCFMYCYVLLTTLSFSITCVVAPILLLSVNDVTTVATFDSLLTDASSSLEATLQDWAFSKPVDWKDAQNALSCCGLGVSSLYVFREESEKLEQLLTGDKCADGKGNYETLISSAVANATEFAEFQKSVASDPIVGDGTDFFCLNKIGNHITDLTIPIGVAAGVLAFLQLLNVRAAFVVLYRIGYSAGGFVEEDEFLDTDSDMGKGGGGGGGGGNGSAYQLSAPSYNTTNVMEQGGSNMTAGNPNFGKPGLGSFVNHHRESDVPKANAGYGGAFNRMSKKIFDNDFFNPPKAPTAGAPKPMDDLRQFGNRMSRRVPAAAAVGNRLSTSFRGFGAGGPGGAGGGGGFGNRMSKKFGFGGGGGGSGFGRFGGEEEGSSVSPGSFNAGPPAGGSGPPRPPVPGFGGMMNRMSKKFKPSGFGPPPGFGGGSSGGGGSSSGGGFGSSGGSGYGAPRGPPSFGGPPRGPPSGGPRFGGPPRGPPSGGSSFAPPPGFGGGASNNRAAAPSTGFGGPPIGGPGGRGGGGGGGGPSNKPKKGGFGGMFGRSGNGGGGGGGGAPARKPPGGGGRGGLLGEIQGGARLKKTVVNDRSSPEVQARIL